MTFRYGIPFRTNYRLMFLADFFNITNRVNDANIGSSFVGSNGFLNPSVAYHPREFQFGIRFTF